MRRLVGTAATACAIAAALTGPSPPVEPAAAAAAENRAVVIVDTGREVRRVCVRFTEDSLTGQELLVRAGTDPVFRQYSGLGAAVCALCGVGCPADDSCLTCGGDTYWAYSRAPKGTSEFKLSGGGASQTRVHDGDVEGWRWSAGLLPAYASVEQVCGPAPGASGSTTSSLVATTTPTAAGAPTPTPAVSGDAATRSAPGPSDTTAVTTTTVATTTTTTGNDDDEQDRQAAPPTVPTADDDGGGSAVSTLAFAAVLTALVGWAVWLRRARTRRPLSS